MLQFADRQGGKIKPSSAFLFVVKFKKLHMMPSKQHVLNFSGNNDCLSLVLFFGCVIVVDLLSKFNHPKIHLPGPYCVPCGLPEQINPGCCGSEIH